MPIIEKYKILDFSKGHDGNVLNITVPEDSKFLGRLVVLHDGIYGFYSISEIVISDLLRQDKYVVLLPKQAIPDNSELIDILSVITEIPDGNGAETTQGMMIFPVYKINLLPKLT